MRSLRGRVALAAVAATAVALLLVSAVVVATLLRDERAVIGDRLREQMAQAGAADRQPGVRFRPPTGDPDDTFGPFGRRFGGRFGARLGPLRATPMTGEVGTRLLVVGVAALGVVGAASWSLSGLALRPLGRLRAAAERVASTRDLGTRLPADEAAAEVAGLAASLNAMLARLEQSAGRTETALEANRRFVADAGHELRTPLTSITANLDVLDAPALDPGERSRVIADLRRESARLVALLDALQALARGDSSAITRERLDVADVVDAAVAAARARHPGRTVGFVDPGAVPLDGWPQGLRLAVDNLVENALRHGRDEVRVAVSSLAGAAGDGVTPRAAVVVDDDGPGIPVADRARVLERFTRGATTAPGSGLGLALVAQQAQLHGGAVRIEDGPLGGARVTLTVAGMEPGDGAAATRPPRG